MTPHMTRRLSALRRIGLAALLRRLLAAEADRRSRQALLHLDDRLLRDVGVTRAQALEEAGRTDWDAPLHWHR